MMKLYKLFLILFLCFLPITAWAAFPTTGVLDNFNRANEGPPLSTSWTDYYGDTGGLQVDTNTCIYGWEGGYGSEYWNVATFGPDIEVYLTIITKGGTGESIFISIRLQDNLANPDGYLIMITVSSGTDAITLYRLDNGSFVQLGSPLSQEITNGDSYGIEMIGNRIKIYRKASGGSWTDISSGGLDDATYSTGGRIGLSMDANTNFAVDDFGGGTVSAAPPAAPQGQVIWWD